MLTVTLLVCGLMVATRASNNTEEDPVDDLSDETWNDFDGRSYFFVSTNLTWAEAEKNCLSMKANLASVHNTKDYEFIHDLIRLCTNNSPRTWIGGSDCQQRELWLWSDGTDFTFSMWSPGQPDDLNGQQACLQMNYGETHLWDDTSCSDQLPSVCAKTL